MLARFHVDSELGVGNEWKYSQIKMLCNFAVFDTQNEKILDENSCYQNETNSCPIILLRPQRIVNNYRCVFNKHVSNFLAEKDLVSVYFLLKLIGAHSVFMCQLLANLPLCDYQAQWSGTLFFTFDNLAGAVRRFVVSDQCASLLHHADCLITFNERKTICFCFASHQSVLCNLRDIW